MIPDIWKQGKDARLVKLTERLYQLDELLWCHSDCEIHGLSNEDLLNHFKSVYSKKKLRTETNCLDQNLVKEGDEFLLGRTKEYNRSVYPFWLDPITPGHHEFSPLKNTKGVIKKVITGQQALVDWGNKLESYANDRDLVVYGRKENLWRKEKSYPLTRGDLLKLKRRDLVKYIGNTRSWGHYHLKEEVLGRVVTTADSEIDLLVQGNDQIIVRLNFNLSCTHLRKNNIDFGKLYREFFGEDLEEMSIIGRGENGE